VSDEEHRKAMQQAIDAEAAAQRALMAGRPGEASLRFRMACVAWERSWSTAPPRSYGRLIGMLKAAVLAGDASDAAGAVRGLLGDEADSPPSWYALAIAALVEGDDALAQHAAAGMRGGSDAFDRTADAVEALATNDGERFEAALRAIVADFEQREEHLTGVPIADTALMLDRLARPRGMATEIRSPLLPA
jgi:hypothetical protein